LKLRFYKIFILAETAQAAERASQGFGLRKTAAQP